MAFFKEDWSFLDKITMGAVGTEKVIEKLNEQGHHIIELERYCTSNKIWSTKIKRLRIPDLLCLHCGRRIESRAKSKLGIIMSDADKNPDRRWFSGLRDTDLIAFIQCYKDVSEQWNSNGVVNLFSVHSLKEKENTTTLSAPKSVNEGAERDRRWKCYVPSFDFKVDAVEQEEDGFRVRLVRPDGRRQSRRISTDEFIYIDVNDEYPANSKIVAGVVDNEINHTCSEEQYDFLDDLTSSEKETIYTAVKALGYLPKSIEAIDKLKVIVSDASVDMRIRLEGYSSLLRLGENVWDDFKELALLNSEKDMKMEFVLILGELFGPSKNKILMDIAKDEACDVELRAAAIWSSDNDEGSLRSIIEYCFSSNEMISNHAIAKIEKHFIPTLTSEVLGHLGDDERINAICSRILVACKNPNINDIVNLYVLSNIGYKVKKWLLYIMGLSGREYYEPTLLVQDPNYTTTQLQLSLMWDAQPTYLETVRADGIAFTKLQK